MLEFNNFRIVNVIELALKSQKSHKSQRIQGFEFSLCGGSRCSVGIAFD